jgi:hypothetical protein
MFSSLITHPTAPLTNLIMLLNKTTFKSRNPFQELNQFTTNISLIYTYIVAIIVARTVWGKNCLRPLKHWRCGFKSHSTHGWMSVYYVYVVLYVGRGLATGWSPVQGILPTEYRSEKLKKRQRPNKGLWSHNNLYISPINVTIYYY